MKVKKDQTRKCFQALKVDYQIPPLSQRDVSRYLSQWSSLFSLSNPWSHEARNDVWWTHAQGYQAHWERQQLSMTLHPCGSHTSPSRNTKKL